MGKYPIYFKLIFLALFCTSCSYQFDDGRYAPPENCLVVHTSDQVDSASLSVISLDTLEAVNNLADGLVHTDAALAAFEGNLFVVNRLGRDNLQLINPYDGYTTVGELSLKSDAYPKPNPHNIVFSEMGEGFLSLYGSQYCVIVDPESMEQTGRVDLGEYGYESKIPCVSALYYDEESGLVFAALQRLDRSSFSPADYSLICSIDVLNQDVSGEFAIETEEGQYTNPYSLFRYVEDGEWYQDSSRRLLISCVGNFELTGLSPRDGGIISCILDDEGAITGMELVLAETEKFGDIVDFLYIEGLIYCVTLNKDEESFFLKYDPETGEYTELLKNDEPGGYLWRLEKDLENRIFLCDRNLSAPGIRVYDTADAILSEVIPTGLPPNDLLVVQ